MLSECFRQFGIDAVSITSDAAWNLFTEFWPDVSRHISFRMVFLRRLAERAAQPN